MTQPGRFVWCEVMTQDPETTLAFWPKLFNWELMTVPMGDFDYTMFSAGGQHVGGVVPMTTEAHDSHWICYLTVDDVDAAAKKAEELGGLIAVPPGDIPNVGRFSMIADPQGAFVTLFKPANDTPESGMPELGQFCWHELMTTDAAAAISFYGALTGWESQDGSMPDMEYHIQMRGEYQAAGVSELAEGVDAPPYWMPYVLVEDVDATSAQAEQMGGQVLVEPTDIPYIGRFSIVMGPDGTVLSPFSAADDDEGAGAASD